MTPNAQAIEKVAIVGSIDPDATAASTVTTAWIDASKAEQFMAVVMAGALGTSATLNAKLEQATDSSGTGAKDITGKAITALTDAGSDSDKQAAINLRQSEMDVDNNFTHFRLSMTVAVATSDVAGFVLAVDLTSGLAADNDEASVDELVA